jgi:hypothetical protein
VTGPRALTPHVTKAMYADYCSGLSTVAVARLWKVTDRTVRVRFRKMGLPLRDRVRNPYTQPGVSFGAESNRARTLLANRTICAQAAEALNRVDSERHRALLRLRIDNPELSMSELGALCDPPLSKDAVSGVLRRALAAVVS